MTLNELYSAYKFPFDITLINKKAAIENLRTKFIGQTIPLKGYIRQIGDNFISIDTGVSQNYDDPFSYGITYDGAYFDLRKYNIKDEVKINVQISSCEMGYDLKCKYIFTLKDITFLSSYKQRLDMHEKYIKNESSSIGFVDVIKCLIAGLVGGGIASAIGQIWSDTVGIILFFIGLIFSIWFTYFIISSDKEEVLRKNKVD